MVWGERCTEVFDALSATGSGMDADHSWCMWFLRADRRMKPSGRTGSCLRYSTVEVSGVLWCTSPARAVLEPLVRYKTDYGFKILSRSGSCNPCRLSLASPQHRRAHAGVCPRLAELHHGCAPRLSHPATGSRHQSHRPQCSSFGDAYPRLHS